MTSVVQDSAAVRVAGLDKRFGTTLAVDSVDLTIPEGSIFGLIGPNGAGKTTTLSILATLVRPSAGTVEVLGHDPVREPRAVRRRLGYMPDQLGVYDDMLVDEYLDFFAAAHDTPRKERAALVEALLELVDLTVKTHSPVQSLSRGMKQRLSLARVLVHDPELLILDEPASGLDPRARVELRDLLVRLQGMGKTIVISSHILAELEQVCTDVAIMEAGRLLAAGPPSEILDRLGGGRVIRVTFDDRSTEDFTVADEAEQEALLRRLVGEDERSVLEFTRVGSGLEDLFLSLTEGIVK